MVSTGGKGDIFGKAKAQILCACRLYQVLAFGWSTIPERSVARVTWFFSEFYTPLNFSAMAEDRIVKFCARVGPRSVCLVMTNWPRWAWSRSRDVLKRCKIEIYLKWKTNMKSYMAYQMAATVMILNDLQGHSPAAGLFKCNPSNIFVQHFTQF